MSEVTPLTISVMPTPIGRLWLVSGGGALHALLFESRLWSPEAGEPSGPATPPDLLRRLHSDSSVADSPPEAISTALDSYFAGDLTAIDAVPTAAQGSPFQRAVWAELRAIPAGTTVSYGEIARRVGQPSASRAVGLANGANPIALVVPCHRVVGASGSLTGYGGGLARKRWLLGHEAAHAGLFASASRA